MQAFGSISAVFIAIWVTTYQDRKEREREKNKESARRSGVLTLALQTAATVTNVSNLFNSSGDFYVSGALDMLRVCISSLEKIPLHEAPYIEHIDEIGQLLIILINMRGALEVKRLEVSRNGFVSAEHKAVLDQVLDHYTSQTEKVKGKLSGSSKINLS